jgi:APA family basic amino acid/polyamine antiporter
VTEAVPDHTTNIILWIIGGLIALCGAASLAEMASAYPKAGGDYVYVTKGFGRRMGFSFGMMMAVVGFAAPLALMAYTFGSLISPIIVARFGIDSGWTHTMNVSLASAAIVVLTFLHARGYEESEGTQAFTTISKLLVLVLFGCAMYFYRATELPTHFADTVVRSDKSWTIALATNLTLILYAYTGWNAAAYMASEVVAPETTVKKALITGTFIVTALYIFLNIGYAAVFSPQDILAMTNDQRAAFSNSVLQAIFPPNVADLCAIVLGLGMIASISSVVVSGSRLVFAMADDGVLPRHLVKVCTTTGLPKQSIWAQSIVAMLLLLTGSFQQLLSFAGFGLVAVSVFVVLPIFILRRTPDYRPTFRVPFYPWLPLLFCASCILIFVVAALENLQSAAFGMAIVFLAYVLSPRSVSKHHKATREAESL